MAAITEDYVSFEIAKLLNEKGFDEECIKVIHKDTKNEYYFGNYTDDIKGRLLLVPTLQMAMKWLRKVHNIHIYTIDTFIGFKYVIQDMFHHDEDIHPIDGICFSSNKEACEEAIKYCLENLI